jgi:hypothetical protein
MPIFQDAKGKNISNFQKMIDEKKNTIRKYYDEIGHLYYGQYKDVNVDVTKDINARCESISNLYIEIDDLYIKILRERGLKKCAVCGTENNLSNAFCFKCGARFDDSDAVPADVIAPPNASATPSRKIVEKPAPAPVVAAPAPVVEPEPVVEEPAEEPAEEPEQAYAAPVVENPSFEEFAAPEAAETIDEAINADIEPADNKEE